MIVFMIFLFHISQWDESIMINTTDIFQVSFYVSHLWNKCVQNIASVTKCYLYSTFTVKWCCHSEVSLKFFLKNLLHFFRLKKTAIFSTGLQELRCNLSKIGRNHTLLLKLKTLILHTHTHTHTQRKRQEGETKKRSQLIFL